MKSAFELPFSRHPEIPLREACRAVQARRGYPLADISSLAFAASGESACHSGEGMF
ncbi:hypothetical protein RJJ37_19510 [Rhizobium redzepovicii]|uniref:Uncharacterized protein n=1 Tax=Rhizobium redzepovicii TaxID=2867518 RepID=A0AAW8P3Y4_9HYPH|nr:MULTISPECIES: hypothetical protein [Rhizobium]MBB3526141.1 hypothetical protein [Rhizobium sp. BK456]MBY4589835.1 hypothetical protein [Rhizobium redzepovicii]MBY4614342.1 hypothetical protein [Rhizobium redzepovicii]MDF0661143.1 hypothetical protein [Rhizobium sp. BC49]MDR9761793.1 hypothetical protein [Rhizobium redzepovicii]